MNVPFWVWALTIVVLLAVLAVDLVVVGRRPHEIGIAEAGRWVAIYVGLATLFAAGLFLVSGQQPMVEFIAGYITEYSLSVDNLFVFLLIMSAFKVPRLHQHRTLLFGIAIALLLRAGFIAVGAAVVSRFSWMFYLFGLFLVLTAIKVLFSGDEDDEFRENVALRTLRRILPITDDFDEAKTVVRRGGKWMITPMLMVMITIGMTDLLFALDSIPAIFGLTTEPYLVFTANVFALMGLRQLYFLLGELLRSLVYLSWGLGVILGFIGVKLVLEALHTNTLPFLGGGAPVPVPTIGIELSLLVIVGVLTLTTVASLVRVRFFPTEKPPEPEHSVEPAPVEPAPVEPAPVEPAPVEPAPVEPARPAPTATRWEHRRSA